MKRPWPRWAPRRGEHPEQHYLVAPRHLAGAGDPRHIIEYLHACGWKNRTSRTNLEVLLENPDRTARIAFSTHVVPPGWTISGTPADGPAWHATFGPRTPVEIIGGFTDALARPRPVAAPDVWAPLAGHGWSTATTGPYTATHPDRSAELQYRTTADRSGFWWAGAHGDRDGRDERLWEAVFSPHTPMHLVAAFSAALAERQPLLRPPGEVPASWRIRARPVSILPSQLASWRHDRATAAARTTARARAWPIPRSRPASPPTPSGRTR
ncbi:protein of unknown function DUF317 [Actinobacteria bacterium OK074]|nr:protein of unknown function DUF317 [Actinobacteria bacterium OK074]